MSFSNLSPIAQNILMVQFEFFGKIFLLGFFLVAAIYFIFKHKNQDDTPYLLLALVRTWVFALSWIYIFFFPLFIIFLYPQISIDKILGPTFLVYRYASYIIGLLMFFNILYYGPLIVAKLGGLNIMSKNANMILDSLLGKYKKLFKR